MRRSLPFRIASALMAMSFALLIVQPNGMRMMAMGGMTHAHAGTRAVDDMAGMIDRDPAPTKQDQPTDCSRHDCCCGCVTTAVFVPQAAEMAWLPAVVFRRELPQPAERAALPAGEHVIPFAIGPPAALIG